MNQNSVKFDIIAHNNRIGEKDLKWRITNNAIKILAGSSNQRAIDRIITGQQQAIDAHHATHGLEANHNAKHKRKRKISEAIEFPLELQPE
ncbi:hypothetical protein H6F67_00205 [Microcoleus sp. FACHB-1515]|uniref:hypothetical protein n=1 Tax=Cyanophyceae TaxID=3028117 RepID=UPI0016876796|nr:hypothetical protein [Microcoleus sp. FACHB-1515]MBD2088297.1 hypothetical protein [Microcoleus sp. FACHB-1515]